MPQSIIIIFLINSVTSCVYFNHIAYAYYYFSSFICIYCVLLA